MSNMRGENYNLTLNIFVPVREHQSLAYLGR